MSDRTCARFESTPREADLSDRGGAWAPDALRHHALSTRLRQPCLGQGCGPNPVRELLQTSFSRLDLAAKPHLRHRRQSPNTETNPYLQVSLTGLTESWTSAGPAVTGSHLSDSNLRHAFQGVDVIAFTLGDPSPHAGNSSRMPLGKQLTAAAFRTPCTLSAQRIRRLGPQLVKAATFSSVPHDRCAEAHPAVSAETPGQEFVA